MQELTLLMIFNKSLIKYFCMIDGVQIIAEVKTGSPFGFKSGRTWGELFKTAERAGDVISIHTDPATI